MGYFIAQNTDVGIKRTVNQDSLGVYQTDTIVGEIVFAIVCDGMGGLSDGEYASQSTVEALKNWYNTQLIDLINSGLEMCELKKSMETVLIQHNDCLVRYGQERQKELGTTASAILLLPGRYFAIHVGDSRIYMIEKKKITQITEDHSRVYRDVKMGLITHTEAKKDMRKNQLLQCIGGHGGVHPEFVEGDINEDTLFLLCSDGFVHKIDEKEMWKSLRPNKNKTENQIEQKLKTLTELNKKRLETDNISAMAVKVVED